MGNRGKFTAVCRNCGTEIAVSTNETSEVQCPECDEPVITKTVQTGKIKAVGGTIIPDSASGYQIR